MRLHDIRLRCPLGAPVFTAAYNLVLPEPGDEARRVFSAQAKAPEFPPKYLASEN